MANKIHNCNMSLEEVLAEEEPVVTPLYGGNPTQEEAELAFEKLFEESNNAFNNFMNIRR